MSRLDVFDEIYQEYLNELSTVDLPLVKDRLGIEVDREVAIIHLFGMPYRVSPAGILSNEGQRPSHSVSVVLSKYLLLCPETEPPGDDWVTYKDFKDAAPFVHGFTNNAERPIARVFSGRLPQLKQAAEKLSGRPSDVGVASDLVMTFDALPKIPMLMLFNDQDEDFPAQCSLLFQSKAEKYLDMECLAMVGWALSGWLQRLVGEDRPSEFFP